jgi:hypothetical protein
MDGRKINEECVLLVIEKEGEGNGDIYLQICKFIT